MKSTTNKLLFISFLVVLFACFCTRNARQPTELSQAAATRSITATPIRKTTTVPVKAADRSVSVATAPAVKNNSLCEAWQDEAVVSKIVDGDTIDVQISGRTYRVRYIGIDTPEMSSNDCYAKEATERNRQLVQGKIVCLEKDISETDRYGRLLRYVYQGNTFINASLVREGYAQAFTYPPDVAHASDFVALQQQARNERAGLWSGCGVESESKSAAPAVAVCTCNSNQYNCSDFSTHAQAQECYKYCLAQAGYDVHKLDGDSDGSACETLP